MARASALIVVLSAATLTIYAQTPSRDALPPSQQTAATAAIRGRVMIAGTDVPVRKRRRRSARRDHRALRSYDYADRHRARPYRRAVPLPAGRILRDHNVTPGEYVLQTWSSGAFAAQFVSVADTDVTGIALRTTIGSTVRGHINLGGAASVKPQDFQFNFVQTDLDLGLPPGTYRAKINDDFTFEYVGLFGPLLIRPAGGPEWMLKSV